MDVQLCVQFSEMQNLPHTTNPPPNTPPTKGKYFFNIEYRILSISMSKVTICICPCKAFWVLALNDLRCEQKAP